MHGCVIDMEEGDAKRVAGRLGDRFGQRIDLRPVLFVSKGDQDYCWASFVISVR